MTSDQIYARLCALHIEASEAESDHLLIEAAVTMLVETVLSVGVRDWQGREDDAIAEILRQKVHGLLLTEVAKINGT